MLVGRKKSMYTRAHKILLFFTMLLLPIILMSGNPPVAASPTPTISVEPQTISGLMPGETFSVDIVVSNVENLWGYNFVLGYDTNILTATDYSSYDPFTYSWPSEINDTEGYVSVAYSMAFGVSDGLSTVEPAPMARINFTVDALGMSPLHLYSEELADVEGNIIPRKLVDGSFLNVDTRISVCPTMNMGIVNETFHINITIAEVNELWGYQFNLTYDADVLNVTSVTTCSPFIIEWSSEINDTAGYVAMNYSIGPDDPPFEAFDPVPIARVNFTVYSVGWSELDLHDTKLGKIDGELVPHEVVDGMFSNAHDVAIDPSSFSISPDEVLLGDPVTINVTVINQGDFIETFNVTVEIGNIIIETQTVTDLVKGDSMTLSFTWDTTGYPEGSYTIRAKAILSADVKTLDNVSPGRTAMLAESQMAQAMILYALAVGTGVFVPVSLRVYSWKTKKSTVVR